MPKGGALKSVYIVTTAMLRVNGGEWILQQGPALKVRGFKAATLGNQKVIGGDALPVYVVPEANLEINGGRWKVYAGQPTKITDVIGAARGIIQGCAIPICPVDDNGNYDPTFADGDPGGWSPLDHPSTRVWLDASQIAGLSDGDPVTLWEDLMGTIIGFTQVTAAKKPTYVTGVQNGLPIVRFDGVDDFLYATAEFMNFTDPTLFLVMKGSASPWEVDYWDSGDNAVTNFIFNASMGVLYGTIQHDNTGADPIGGDYTVMRILCLRGVSNMPANGMTGYLYQNGILVSSDFDAAYPAGGTWEANTIGPPSLGIYPNGVTAPLTGDIAEAIWCDNLALADHPLFWNYLNTKWAVY